MVSIFPGVANEDSVPESFQELWNSLASRNKQKYEYLRAHQLKILETLYERIMTSKRKDYAISLPTGTGKTVVGLLLLHYLMLKRKLNALYLCPNIFLCNQVAKDAEELGIPAVPLYGKWSKIPDKDKGDFYSGNSIGIATYATLFNSNPQVGKIGLIMMDDVHVAGDAIISNWSIKIERKENNNLFDQVYETIRPILNKPQKNALDAKSNSNGSYEMLYTKQWLPLIDDLVPILESHSESEELKYHWKNIKKKLENYFCILHSNSIEIKPLTPPSHTIVEFNDAKFRFYMSATLDYTGNLENNVGIEGLEWIYLSDVDVPGNRLILNLNSLMPKETDENRVISIAQKVKKIVILTQSSVYQAILEDALQQAGYKGNIFTPKSEKISGDVEKFKKAKRGVLLLAGRYDGIDLGNGYADGIVIYNSPQAINSFESFTTLKWETKDESEARAIQRIHQGMGRCTRKDSDEVQIFLIGEDLIKLLLNPQTISSFPGKLKKELEICKEMKDSGNLYAYLTAFQDKNSDWTDLKKQIIRDAAKLNPGNLENITKNKNLVFSKYSNLLWAGNYEAAQSLADDLMQKSRKDGREKDSAIWAYLGGVASDISAFISGKNPFLEPGNQLFSDAISMAHNREWFGTLSNYIKEEKIQPSFEFQVENIHSTLKKFSSLKEGFVEHINGLIEKLQNGEDKNIKQFLQEFGMLLGYNALVPSRQGSPDCIWSSQGNADFIFEAKTNKTNDFLTIDEVRQIISLPDEVKNNEKLEVSADLLTICVTDVEKIAKEEFEMGQKFYVLRTANLETLSKKWLDRLLAIQKRAFKDEHYLRYQIQQALIVQRLTNRDLRNYLYSSKGNNILKAK